MFINMCIFYIYRFLSSSKKVFIAAEKENLSGDEEKAYVYYMKYFNVISEVKKTSQFKNNKVIVFVQK